MSDEFKKSCEEHYQSMDDNTQVNDEENKLRFIKMNMPASTIDFLMDYYKLSNVVEVNQAAIFVLKSLAHMEQEGYKFGLYKTKIVDEKEIIDEKDSFALNISEMIQKILGRIDKK